MYSVFNQRILAIAALLLIGLSIYQLEKPRAGIEITELSIASTPATRYRVAGGDNNSPLVIVAHGFAGSRQLMQAFSLTLANNGYDVIAFDFEGHGRNPVPMSGDVTAIDGTTRLLVEETRRVITAARDLTTNDQGITLLGHSMATDVILRAALAEESGDVMLHSANKPENQNAKEPANKTGISTIVGISMFSEVVDATTPSSLLIINGQWEARLRAPALRQLQMIDPAATEGDTVESDNTVRRVVVAPGVEHVSVLYSTTALREALAWIDMTYGRSSTGLIANLGAWILLLLCSIVMLFKPVTSWLPATSEVQDKIPASKFWLAALLPAAITPSLALLPDLAFLPVLIADYLLLHLALYGIIQLVILRSWLTGFTHYSAISASLLCFWGIVIFGFALDRYAASFLPTGGRFLIIAVLSIGTVIFMISDTLITQAGRGALWRRVVARTAFMSSLAAAAFIDTDRLIFLLLILPLLLLFYLVHGLMGRWIAQRAGVLASGVGLGLCLAWALGVSFPLFEG